MEKEEAAGDWVWVQDPEEAYVPARVISTRRDGKTEVQLQSGERRVLKAKSPMFPLAMSSLQRQEQDLVLLDSLDEGYARARAAFVTQPCFSSSPTSYTYAHLSALVRCGSMIHLPQTDFVQPQGTLYARQNL